MTDQSYSQQPPNIMRGSSQGQMVRAPSSGQYPPQMGMPPQGNQMISQVPMRGGPPPTAGHPIPNQMQMQVGPSRSGQPPPGGQPPGPYPPMNPQQMNGPGGSSYPMPPQRMPMPMNMPPGAGGGGPMNYYNQEAIPESLEELYQQKRSAMYKGLFNYQNYGGKREKKIVEPYVQATQEDFLLTEMANMAIDFDEEKIHKRLLMIRLAREAQRAIAKKVNKNKPQVQVNQLPPLEEEKQPMIIKYDFDEPFNPNEVLPDPNKLQIRVSLSGIFKSDEPSLFHQETLKNDNGDSDQSETQEQHNFFNEPFNEQNFLHQPLMEPSSPLRPIIEEDQMQIDTSSHPNVNGQQTEQEFDPKKLFYNGNMVQPDVADTISTVDISQKDLIEDIDLFYLQTSFGEDQQEIDYEIPQKHNREIIEESKNIILNKVKKYDDIIRAQLLKKEQEKMRKKMEQAAQSNNNQNNLDQIPPLNPDSFLIGGNQDVFGNRVNQIQSNNHNNANQSMEIDFDFEKPKVKLYIPHDIIGECFNPQDFQGLIPIEDEISSDEEDQERLEQYVRAKQNSLRVNKEERILRPDNEECFSDEDLDFMKLFPDTHEAKYMEPFLKLVFESYRKNPAQGGGSANDPLLHPLKVEKQIHKWHLYATNLNPCGQIDPDIMKQVNVPMDQRRMWNQFEVAFLNWYVSIFGDEWKLIADVINYHPLTKGRIRDADEIKSFFLSYNESFNLIYHKKIQISPWRNSGLALLINQRPPSLLNCVQQQCLIHQNSIKIYVNCQKKAINIKRYYFKEENGGRLYIISEQEFQEGGNKSPKDMSSLQDDNKLEGSPDQLVPKKRGRPRKKKNEFDQSEEAKYQQQPLKEHELAMKQYLDEQDDQIMNDMEDENGRFYAYQDKLYYPPKRVKGVDDQLENKLNQYPQEIYNTPMMNSLTKKVDRSIQYVKSITLRQTPIFYLGYLYKKIHQQEKEQTISLENQGKLDQFEQFLKNVLEKRVIKFAQESAEVIEQRAKGIKVQSKDDKLTQERQIKIRESLKDYVVEDNIAGVDQVGDIWGGHSIFYFDPKAISQQAQQDDDTGGERAHDFLKQTWELKWESMDSYWFQQHKHLSPKEKKQDLPERYFNTFYQQFSQGQSGAPTPGPPRQPTSPRGTPQNYPPQVAQQIAQVPPGAVPLQPQRGQMPMTRGGQPPPYQMPPQGNPMTPVLPGQQQPRAMPHQQGPPQQQPQSMQR